jgi:hypothetical protein
MDLQEACTALHYAVRAGSDVLATLLLQYGCKPNWPATALARASL